MIINCIIKIPSPFKETSSRAFQLFCKPHLAWWQIHLKHPLVSSKAEGRNWIGTFQGSTCSNKSKACWGAVSRTCAQEHSPNTACWHVVAKPESAHAGGATSWGVKGSNVRSIGFQAQEYTFSYHETPQNTFSFLQKKQEWESLCDFLYFFQGETSDPHQKWAAVLDGVTLHFPSMSNMAYQWHYCCEMGFWHGENHRKCFRLLIVTDVRQ